MSAAKHPSSSKAGAPARRPRRASRRTDDHTLEALRSAFDAAREGILVCDAQDRVVFSNRAYAVVVGIHTSPGMPFEEVLRIRLAAGHFPDARGNEDAWLRKRMAERRSPGKGLEMRAADRWLHVTDQRTADGGTLTFVVDISEKKAAEQAALAANKRLRDGLEHLGEMIVLTDADDRIVLANRRFLEFNAQVAEHAQPGCFYADHLKAGIKLGLFPDAIGREEVWLAERIAARHIPKGPVERRRQDGRWLLVDDQQLPDGGIVSYGVEITDRKRAEAEAESARRQLGLALEFARAAVWDFNLVDDVVTISEGWAELATGPGGENSISRRALVDAIHPDDQARTISFFVETLKGASADYSAEYRIRTPAGRWLWILSRGQVSERDAAGRALRMVGINIDITERKRAEEEVRVARRKLQLALDFSKVLLWDYDLHGDTISFSEGRQELMAGSTANRPFSRRELAGAIHPEDLDEAWGTYRAALKGTSPQYIAEYRLRNRDGAWFWVHSRGQVSERTPDGRAVRMIGVNIDISERKVAEEALRTLNAELERRIAERTAALETAYRELESFSYSVSHDLRAPLRSISGYAGLLREDEGERLSEDGRGYLAIIDESARHMGRLIDALLSLAQTSRQTLNREPVDMSKLTHLVANQLGREHPAAILSVSSLPVVDGDPTLLRQVMSNLVGNALKYSARSDPPRVEVGTVTQGSDTTFFVRDNGVGFDMAYADKLFQAFGRLHTDAEFQGTGIGLVLTKLIVERHGGRIWAESRPGAGAQFNFTLGALKAVAA